MKRKVKTAEAALSRTNRPVGDGLENVVAGLGTDRDKAYYSRYGLPRVLDRQELENMYRSSWLAKRIINTIADDMTREWRSVVFDSKNEDQQFAIEKAEKKLKVRAKFNDALRWSRLYGGATIIIGIKNQPLSMPLDPSRVPLPSTFARRPRRSRKIWLRDAASRW